MERVAFRVLLPPELSGESAPAHCHLCVLWASLFNAPLRPLARETQECGNCRGLQGVRGTVRKAIASANPFLSAAIPQVEEPIELDEPA